MLNARKSLGNTKEIIKHTEKKGDSLWSISQKYTNASVDKIKEWNGLSNNSKLKPGMQVKIEKG